GMVVLLAPAYLGDRGGDEGWYAEVRRNGPDKLRGYGRYLGARYRSAPNLVWLEGGDAPPMAAGDEIEALVAGIRDADPVPPHAEHSSRHPPALDDYDRPWLDPNTTYSACEGHGRQLLRDAHRRRTVPTMFIEGTYEGEQASLACTISQAYRTLLSGAAGHVFGNKPIWQFGPGWPEALDSPGSRAMQHLAELIASHDLRGLTPDFPGAPPVERIARPGLRGPRRASPGAPAGEGVASARARSGTTLVFVDAGRRTLQLPAGVERHAAWFDPATGATTDAGLFPAAAPLALT